MEIRDAAMKCEELILEKSVKTNGKANGTAISEVSEEDVNAVSYFNNNRGGFRGGNSSNNRGYRGNNRGNNRGGQNNQMSPQNNSQSSQSNYRGGNNSQRGGRQQQF